MVSVWPQCRTTLGTEQGNGHWSADAVFRGLWMRKSRNAQFTHKQYSAVVEETGARNSPCEPHGVALEHVIVRCIPHGLCVGTGEGECPPAGGPGRRRRVSRDRDDFPGGVAL